MFMRLQGSNAILIGNTERSMRKTYQFLPIRHPLFNTPRHYMDNDYDGGGGEIFVNSHLENIYIDKADPLHAI